MTDTSSEGSSCNEAFPDLQIIQQDGNTQNETLANNKKRKDCRCGDCGAAGHDRRTCPKLDKERRKNQNGSQKRRSNHPEVEPRPTVHLSDVMERFYYIVFDIETTGFSVQRNEITQIAAKIMDYDVMQLEDGLI